MSVEKGEKEIIEKEEKDREVERICESAGK